MMKVDKTAIANAEVRKIISGALIDAQEIFVLIELLRQQNSGSINDSLNKVNAGGSGITIRNALISRLVLLTARCYSPVRKGDRHLHRGIDILADTSIRLSFSNNQTLIQDAIDRFKKHKTDPRQQRLKHFRDKFTAHISEPLNDVSLLTYTDLFEISDLTAQCIEDVSVSLKLFDSSIREAAKADQLAGAFWKPWRQDR